MEAGAQPKVGLALSGGGFRAAFFHLGVLARLAELGVLRRVEVISTVSGGSIVGAAYYLRLKWMLEREPQERITDAMYCELVADVADRLRAMVRRNVRGRIFLNPLMNFRMASPRYSRSDRIGDLYDALLNEHGTYVGPGHWFGQPRSSFRLGFAWPETEELERGLAGLDAAAAAAA